MQTYLYIYTVKKKEANSLFLSKTYDQNGIYQTIVDLTYLDCEQLWKDQFIGKSNTTDDTKGTIKRRFEDIVEIESTLVNDNLKKRRVSVLDNNNELCTAHTYSNNIDKYVDFFFVM